MVALPAHLTIGCPVCDTPFDLPLTTGPARRDGGPLVVALSLDMEPIRSHLRAAHPELLAAKPPDTETTAAATSAASVTFTVRQPPAANDVESAARHVMAAYAAGKVRAR
ncbi:hypothetical protein [Streptomyces cylindrosporus]|uniref:Uncharacterized protein n=1 Tax=Streptomyces cylindrosporus TaxID=2927583 RepID=A0ABS9YK50_9ACTN|nr:hypothetical protein [Streptomyces cylindrosporus]MCI3277640.1 hypothetical protein [Streptomyces cylindrosporus]